MIQNKSELFYEVKACLDGMILSAWQNHIMYDFSV